jgi:hypothetical protein
MKHKNPQVIGRPGHWIIFLGVAVAILGVLLTATLRHGLRQLPRIVGETSAPYIVFFTPVVIGALVYAVYQYLPKRAAIPLGIVGWVLGLSLIYHYFWFGPGAFGHH